MANYSWPPMDQRKVIGKRISRIDGIAKASGRAKYPSDMNRQGMLYAALLSSPHAHAKVRSVDTSEASKMPGVKAIRVISPAGTEIQWAHTEVAVVAAETEAQAKDAVRKIRVEYDVMEHVVQDVDRAKIGSRAKPSGEQVTGDVDTALKESDVISEGWYGIPVLTHCCLEPHGQTIEWKGEKMEYWPSTQNVSGLAGDLGRSLQFPAANISVHQDHMGGGFGSKFNSDRWGMEGAHLSKESGRPVKWFLDRAHEVVIAGVRPSSYAKIKIGAKRDGTILAWESESWASGGVQPSGMPPIPYVFGNPGSGIPNRRMKHLGVSLNTAPQRAWRAPNHPQASFLTCSALDDLAAKLNMDPLELFLKNLKYTPRPETYEKQLKMAADMIEWKKLWTPRGQQKGAVRRGLGIGVNQWQGGGHQSACRVKIHPDSTVEVEIGSQDLGVGTRTIITQVAAESLGLPMAAVKVKLGENAYPSSGASGGSTTVGGVSSSTRKASVNALEKLFAAVAESLGAPADQLEAVDGTIRVKGNPAKSMPWKAACQKLGVNSITAEGENVPKQAAREGLNSAGAAGVQMADVTVDTETGVVKLNKLVAVQDCGLVINPKLAESQVYGACIMSICGALMEERIVDEVTGRVMNADMEFYKLAGIKDIGEIVVHMDIAPEHDKRGVIGLGEPPAVGGIAAIANAVSNAAGVRVPMVPVTPDRVLSALAGRNA
ncbi:MAG TPA: xanthine dehydrogenase family protein molybdopterin-binding subunit [Solibacterales bacterium]|nr:xanthine dehydrogenase family protein molybdopterin-binding subunit [Bryobacterales bacterium]